MPLEPFIELHSRFKIVERLGSGAIGTVYKALDMELNGQVVALKVLHDHLLSDERALQRFRNEVVLSRSVVHPNVVRIFDIATGTDGRQFIVMEFVDGSTLRERIEQEPAGLDSDEVVRIVTAVCDGLQAAHDCGIVHRDLKPDNVLIAADGSIKVADLGLARRLDDAHGLTRTGESIGTAYYMAPEQIKGTDSSTLTDIYALGIITFELLTGKRPYDGSSYYSVIDGHLREPLSDPRSISKTVPRWWWAVLRKATEKNPKHRFKSAQSFSAQLGARASTRGIARVLQETAVRIPRITSPLLSVPLKLSVSIVLVFALALIPIRILAERRETRVAVAAFLIRAEEYTGISLMLFRTFIRYTRSFSISDVPIYLQQDDDITVEIALKLGFDLKKRLPDGRSLLQYALDSGALKSSLVLLNYGAEPNAAGEWQPPLHIAAVAGFPHIVRALVQRGAKIDAVDQFENTALHYAAGAGNIYAVNFLLSAGAQPNRRNAQGDTPYHYGVVLQFCSTCPGWAREEVVRLLAEAGADPEARNMMDQSVSALAADRQLNLMPLRARSGSEQQNEPLSQNGS